jgi:transposase
MMPETIEPDTQNEERLTYPQDWPAYNEAQSNEKLLFLKLLGELTEQIPKQERTGPGRPPADLGEMIFACCMKIYLNFSSRRTESDLKIAQQLGYISHAPHYNTILQYLNKPELKPILTSLVEFSAMPLKQLEDKFAVDSTGFSTSVFSRWAGLRKTKRENYRDYKKCHAMCGVRTNIICSIETSEGYAPDCPALPNLVERTARRFEIKEVLADKAYLSRKNMDVISEHGAIPFVPFRKNSNNRAEGSAAWKAMHRYFFEHREEFMQHYHLRSNIESVFSMMKRKQGTYLRSKNDVAQHNEILCKALVHNICVLIHEMYENDVQIDFYMAEDELMCKSLP